jgi:hypothetical protein
LHFHLISDVQHSKPAIRGATPHRAEPHSGQAV